MKWIFRKLNEVGLSQPQKNALINALMWAKTRIKCNGCYQCTVYVSRLQICAKISIFLNFD